MIKRIITGFHHIKNILLQLFILMIGLLIAHFGVTIFLLTNLGSDPYNVFVQGIFRTLQNIFPLAFLTHGYTHLSISFLIILALLFIDRTYIKIGTIFCMIFGGPIIDLFTLILKGIIRDSLSLHLRIFLLMLGCIILAFGMTVVIKSEAGTGPNDLVAIVISDKACKKFSMIRIIVDFSFVTTGFFLGGVVGIGTVICALLVGPIAGFFLPMNETMIRKIYCLCDKTHRYKTDL